MSKFRAPSRSSVLTLQIERPVAGGRMLARHDGAVVLVAGAIPGELVRAQVEKSARGVIWARVVEVMEPSPARRPAFDQACGGMDYAHMAYDEQLRCKGEVVVDALKRIGRIAVPGSVPVEPSPERGYRLRARLHVADGRAGFFRVGTHVLCDAVATGQLQAECVPAVERVLSALGRGVANVEDVVVAESVNGRQRVVHLEIREHAPASDLRLAETVADAGVTGVTAAGHRQAVALWGAPLVTDTAGDLFGEDAPIDSQTTWVRQAASFFQGNRYLTGPLVRHVLNLAAGDAVADLYAGVGLFAVACAASGRHVVAVEGDQTSALDLQTNAGPFAGRLRVVHAPVEQAATGLPAGSLDAVILDPPRTGVSAEALAAIIRLGAPRVVYVSCDPPTLARDSGKLAAAGYELSAIRAFDLFPNTAHVEAVALFLRPSVAAVASGATP